jgi:hypothetical protein
MLRRERVWTSWRKIDLDIAGERIAFFRSKRLYLAGDLPGRDDQQKRRIRSIPVRTVFAEIYAVDRDQPR